MDCKELYTKMYDGLGQNLQKSLDSPLYPQIASANAFIEDYSLWRNWITTKYGGEIFQLAASEYETALLFSLQSLYKQAFTALRACLEHTLFGIQVSTNLYQYLSWKQNTKDVYWSEITNNETGLFSRNYISLFFSNLVDDSSLILELAKRVYRECSEFTHGNYIAWKSLSESAIYDENLLTKFLDLIKNVRYIIEFSFFVRFANEISASDLQTLEPQISEYLGHFKEVSHYLSDTRRS